MSGVQKMTGNNSKLDLVNVYVHTKFRQILSIHSQAIERKLYSDVNQGPLLRQMRKSVVSSSLDHLTAVSGVQKKKYRQ